MVSRIQQTSLRTPTLAIVSRVRRCAPCSGGLSSRVSTRGGWRHQRDSAVFSKGGHQTGKAGTSDRHRHPLQGQLDPAGSVTPRNRRSRQPARSSGGNFRIQVPLATYPPPSTSLPPSSFCPATHGTSPPRSLPSGGVGGWRPTPAGYSPAVAPSLAARRRGGAGGGRGAAVPPPPSFYSKVKKIFSGS